MSDDLVKRLRMVTGFIRFETGDRVAASACLSEEAAYRIEELEVKLAKAVRIAEVLSGAVEYDYHGNVADLEERQAIQELAELKGQE
jgi:ABC-type Na+ transport system ATPase subunit NatA